MAGKKRYNSQFTEASKRRDARIYELRAAGSTLTELAWLYDVSRERIRYILKREGKNREETQGAKS